MRILKFLSTTAVIAIGLMMASCSSGKTDYESIILEWSGREVIVPDSMRLVNGEVFVKQPSDFTIVSYNGPKACSNCVLRLDKWHNFIEEIEDYSPYSVDVIMISSPLKRKDVTTTVRNTHYDYPLLLDEGDRFLSSNQLPEEPHLRTFLLDSNNRIVLIGNPLDLKEMKKLYLNTLGVDPDEVDEYSDLAGSYYFGRIEPGKEVRHVFNLTNILHDTLRVKDIESSCECTKGIVSPEIIPPHTEYKVEILFKDTVEGLFHRSLTVSFDRQLPEIRFDISGEINNHNIN